MRAFIRGMWGDRMCNVPCYENMLREIRLNRTERWHPSGTVTYCYGSDNADYLRTWGIEGIELEVLSNEPIKNFTGQVERNPSADGWVHYGMSMFYHTLDVLRVALSEFTEVVFLDWDTIQVAPIPGDFWDRLGAGKPFQAGLVRTKRPSCPWRESGANERPHAGFIYCRDAAIIERMMQLYKTMPNTIQETIFALWADEVMGEWSAERWKSEGYEPYCFSFRLQAHPIFAPDKVVFSHKKRWTV